jgi:hypothetical protein
MRTGNLPGGKGWLASEAVNLTAICDPIKVKFSPLQALEALRVVRG